MTCGRKSKMWLWLFSGLLLLFSLPSFAQDAIDPQGIYEISGTKLIELRTTLTEQQTQLDALAAELARYKADLTVAQSELTTSEKAIAGLKASSMELSKKALSAETRATRLRSLSIVLGTTTAAGVLFILATILPR